ncbi:MAG: hypothetical protein ABUT20_15315 [Bacteroidota bacterium]
MKKLLVIGIALALTVGASAQKVIRGGFYRPRTTVVIGGGFGYNPFYSPFYPYYPYPGYNAYRRPTKLDMQVADIKNDYSDRIWSAKHDTNLTRKQRRKEVHELRHERDEAVRAAERNYHLRR